MAAAGVGNMWERFSSPTFDSSALKNFSNLTAPVQKHLQRVYFLLSFAILSAAVGSIVSLYTGLGGGFLTLLGSMGCVIALSFSPPLPQNEGKRVGLLAGAAFFQGLAIGPLLQVVLMIDPAIITTAFLGTLTVFACFSASALLAQKRSWLFLGGILSSGISTLLTLRLASFFFGGREMVFNAELYMGLLIFVGYVVYDTQLIVARAEAGDRDAVSHAMDLFIDFAAIFVRIMIILAKNNESRNRKNSRDSNKRSSSSSGSAHTYRR